MREVSRTSVLLQQQHSGEYSGTHNYNGKGKTKPRGSKTGGAAGAGRRHQHRENPTRRKEGGGARRQHKTEGEEAHKDQRGNSRALTDVPWGSWNIKDEYLSAVVQSNTPTHPKWCRGFYNPTQGSCL